MNKYPRQMRMQQTAVGVSRVVLQDTEFGGYMRTVSPLGVFFVCAREPFRCHVPVNVPCTALQDSMFSPAFLALAHAIRWNNTCT